MKSRKTTHTFDEQGRVMASTTPVAVTVRMFHYDGKPKRGPKAKGPKRPGG
jgi:hypothetical protein